MSLHGLSQRAAFHEVHHEVMQIVQRPNGMNSDDVWVSERRHGACLETKPLHHVLVGQELWGDDLDRHLATQRDVLRQVDRPHGAPADLPDNLELAFRRPGQPSQNRVPERRTRTAAGHRPNLSAALTELVLGAHTPATTGAVGQRFARGDHGLGHGPGCLSERRPAARAILGAGRGRTATRGAGEGLLSHQLATPAYSQGPGSDPEARSMPPCVKFP